MTIDQKINDLFALWDPLGTKKIEPGMQYDEYKIYSDKIATNKVLDIKNYLIEIFTDMVDNPNKFQMREIETMEFLINKILSEK
ncbi:MAG: hypothetical protein ABIT08_16040 [Bacteroidia bacterium]